jgi:hypothetical protein
VKNTTSPIARVGEDRFMDMRALSFGTFTIIAAFAAAFVISSSGGSSTGTAGAGVMTESIKLASPPTVAGVEVGGTLPALQAERRARVRKDPVATKPRAPRATTPTAPRPAPTTPAAPRAIPVRPTTPQVTAPSRPAAPKPSTPSRPSGPISGGGEDG